MKTIIYIVVASLSFLAIGPAIATDPSPAVSAPIGQHAISTIQDVLVDDIVTELLKTQPDTNVLVSLANKWLDVETRKEIAPQPNFPETISPLIYAILQGLSSEDVPFEVLMEKIRILTHAYYDLIAPP